MKCDRIRELNSGLYEGNLATELRGEAERHLQQCAACRVEYGSFVRTTRALRELQPDPASELYVSSILSALGESSVPARAWAAGRVSRRVGSHVAALLIGAAAVALVWFGVASAGGRHVAQTELASSAAPRIVEVPKIVERIERDPALLRATQRLAGSVDGMRHALELWPPVPERSVVLQRVPRASYTRAVDRLGFSIELLRRTLEREQELTGLRLARAPSGPASMGAPLVLGVVNEAPVESASPSSRIAPVRIRRETNRIVLETHGPLHEVVPSLIAHLDDPERDVRDLVRRELDSIQRQLTPAYRPQSPEQKDPTDSVTRLVGLWRSRPPDPVSFDRPGRAQWLAWWISHGSMASESELL